MWCDLFSFSEQVLYAIVKIHIEEYIISGKQMQEKWTTSIFQSRYTFLLIKYNIIPEIIFSRKRYTPYTNSFPNICFPIYSVIMLQMLLTAITFANPIRQLPAMTQASRYFWVIPRISRVLLQIEIMNPIDIRNLPLVKIKWFFWMIEAMKDARYRPEIVCKYFIWDIFRNYLKKQGYTIRATSIQRVERMRSKAQIQNLGCFKSLIHTIELDSLIVSFLLSQLILGFIMSFGIYLAQLGIIDLILTTKIIEKTLPSNTKRQLPKKYFQTKFEEAETITIKNIQRNIDPRPN